MATVRATETFAAFTESGVVGVAENQAFDSSDPMVKKYPEKFAADEPVAKRGRKPRVEQATAAPGELRDL